MDHQSKYLIYILEKENKFKLYFVMERNSAAN